MRLGAACALRQSARMGDGSQMRLTGNAGAVIKGSVASCPGWTDRGDDGLDKGLVRRRVVPLLDKAAARR